MDGGAYGSKSEPTPISEARIFWMINEHIQL